MAMELVSHWNIRDLDNLAASSPIDTDEYDFVPAQLKNFRGLVDFSPYAAPSTGGFERISPQGRGRDAARFP